MPGFELFLGVFFSDPAVRNVLAGGELDPEQMELFGAILEQKTPGIIRDPDRIPIYSHQFLTLPFAISDETKRARRAFSSIFKAVALDPTGLRKARGFAALETRKRRQKFLPVGFICDEYANQCITDPYAQEKECGVEFYYQGLYWLLCKILGQAFCSPTY